VWFTDDALSVMVPAPSSHDEEHGPWGRLKGTQLPVVWLLADGSTASMSIQW
jgi:hypothetical protein